VRSDTFYSNPFATLLSGGVGGARMARALAGVVPGPRLTVVVNVGDDETMYGVHVSADIDTVVHTLAGIEGPRGWGIAGDTFAVMDQLDRMGVNTAFRLGDRDLAMCLHRTNRMAAGAPLSRVVEEHATALGVTATVVPVTDDAAPTVVVTSDGTSRSFQEYFVLRGQRDDVAALDFPAAERAQPAPGVLDAITEAALVVIAPSNPPLSIWPMLTVPGVRSALEGRRVVAVSPLFGGKPVKGPADRVLSSLGLPAGTPGILEAYDGVITDLVIDVGDEADRSQVGGNVEIHTADTRITDPDAGKRFASWLVDEFA